jgi:hypothetical protein
MKTEELIQQLAATANRPAAPISRVIIAALVAGISLSAMLLVAALHLRADLALAAFTPAFCFKLTVTLVVAATATALLPDVARPWPPVRRRPILLLAPLLLMAGTLVELCIVPANAWSARLIGHNASHCLSLIPLLSLAPATSLLLALRRGAPTRPGFAGAIAGLAAGGIGAALYALTCPNDSALYVATWYSVAICTVTAASGFVGSRLLRW